MSSKVCRFFSDSCFHYITFHMKNCLETEGPKQRQADNFDDFACIESMSMESDKYIFFR